VSASRLGFYGDQSVTVGGVGWKESVGVHRRGWVPAGASAVYNVYVTPPEDETRHVYSSENATADPVVAGRQVRVTSSSGGIDLNVLRNKTVIGSTGIPRQNETNEAGGLTFVRNGSRVLAEHENTTISIASRESYE
jgi:hypothetical protein